MMIANSHFIKLFILANILIAFGLLINFALPPLISVYIDSQIALKPGSQSYPMWKDIPIPIYQKFYFFNVTNAQDIEQRGHKPNLEEIGPFVYRTEWTKTNIESNDKLNTINYKHIKQWHFEPDMSIADHRLQLVTLNAPLAITLTLIQSASNAVRLLVTFSLDGLSDGFFTKRSVKQLLFDGYPDLLTTFGPLLNAEMLSQGGHFGYMNARNNSQDGAYEINTGVDDIYKMNTINRYNGRTRLTYWSQHHGTHCNSLEGATNGDIFPPVKNNQTYIKLFQPDFCRAWKLNYDHQYDHEPTGLRLKRFIATRDIFRNSTDLPENICYFPNKRSHSHNNVSSNTTSNHSSRPATAGFNRSGRQQRGQQQRQDTSSNNQHDSNNNNRHHSKVRQEWPNGVFTLAPCKFNAPIYMSMPHFLDADPYFTSHVNGLEPDKNKHEFFVDLEPRTGSPVSVSARVQINVALSRPPGLVRFRNIPEIMFPVFWQEVSVNVAGPVIDQILLASKVEEATVLIAYVFYFLAGAVMLTVAAFYIHERIGQAIQSFQK